MSEPWQPPQYEEIRIRPGYTDMSCPRCGTVVTDIIAHNRHHKALDDLKDGILGLSQILVPDLPHGMMLTPQPAVKINFVPPKAEGGEGGAGAVGIRGHVTVGRGGKGNQPGFPECPICEAEGGGGHGGGCPNAGKPVSQWVSS